MEIGQPLLLVGLAAVPVRYLERPHVLSAWSALPVDQPKPPEMPSMSGNATEDELEEQLDERQVAAKDPLAGLLQMQVGESCNSVSREAGRIYLWTCAQINCLTANDESVSACPKPHYTHCQSLQ